MMAVGMAKEHDDHKQLTGCVGVHVMYIYIYCNIASLMEKRLKSPKSRSEY